MSDTNGTNGNGEKMRAIAESVKLQAIARLSMVTAPPVIGLLVALAGWHFRDLATEVRISRDTLASYVTKDEAVTAKHAEQIKGLERRTSIIEGRVFGFSPPPQANP